MQKVYKVIGVEYKENLLKGTSSLRLDLTRNGFYRTIELSGDNARKIKDTIAGDTFEIEED